MRATARRRRVELDCDEVERQSDHDFFTVQYEESGVERWRALAGTLVPVGGATSLAVDATGNALVAGTWNGYDYLTTKYGAAGAELWRREAGALAGTATSVATHPAGGVVVTGRFVSYPSTPIVDSLTIRYGDDG